MFVIGHKIANASGGGLLGLGDKISDSEKQSLDKISKILNFSDSDLEEALSIIFDLAPSELAKAFEKWASPRMHMSIREKFEDKEWLTLQLTPFWVFNQVANADGNIDQKEKKYFVEFFQQEVNFNNFLVRRILVSISNSFDRVNSSFLKESRGNFEGIKDAVALVDKISPEDSRMFRISMFVIGHRIANASGGVLLGLGNKICDSEKQSLDKISKILNFSESDLEKALSIIFDSPPGEVGKALEKLASR